MNRRRAVALLLLAAFTMAVVGTTVASLGRYCLTTDGGDLGRLYGPP